MAGGISPLPQYETRYTTGSRPVRLNVSVTVVDAATKSPQSPVIPADEGFRPRKQKDRHHGPRKA